MRFINTIINTFVLENRHKMAYETLFIVWLTGALTAWMHMRYWNRNYPFSTKDYVALTAASFISWGLYIIIFIEWLKNKINI